MNLGCAVNQAQEGLSLSSAHGPPLTGILGAEVNEAIPGNLSKARSLKIKFRAGSKKMRGRPHVALVFEINGKVHEVKPAKRHVQSSK